MIDIFLNLVLKMRLKDKVKRISTQSKDIEKRFNSLLIVLSKEEGFKTRHLPELADRLGIASKNIVKDVDAMQDIGSVSKQISSIIKDLKR